MAPTALSRCVSTPFASRAALRCPDHLGPQHTPHRATPALRCSMHSIVGSGIPVFTWQILTLAAEPHLAVHVLRVQETSWLVRGHAHRNPDRLLRHGAGSYLRRYRMSQSATRIAPSSLSHISSRSHSSAEIQGQSEPFNSLAYSHPS